jgi:transposase
MVGMETSRRDHTDGKPLARRLDRHIAFLTKERAAVDRDIGQAIQFSPAWRETAPCPGAVT